MNPPTTNIRDLARAQLQVLMGKAEVKGKGVFTPPPLDLDAIKFRADELNPKSQTKADIYMLLMEIEKHVRDF